MKAERDRREMQRRNLQLKLKSTRDSLVTETKNVQIEMAALQKEKEELNKTRQELQNQLGELRAMQVRYRNDAHEVYKGLEDVERAHLREMAKLKASEEHCYSKAKQHQNNVHVRAKKRKVLASQRRQLEREKNTRDRILDGIKTRVEEAREEMGWKGDETGKLMNECSELVKEEHEIRKQSSALVTAQTAKIEALGKQRLSEKEMRLNLDKQLTSAQEAYNKDRIAFDEERTELSAALDTFTKEIEELARQVHAKTKSCEQLGSTIQHLVLAIPDLQCRIEQRHTQHSETKAKLESFCSDLESCLPGLRDEADRLQKPIDDFDNQCAVVVDALRICTEKRLEKQQQIDSRNTSLRNLQIELQRVTNPYNEAKQSLAEAEKQLREMIQANSQEIMTLEDRYRLVQEKHDIVRFRNHPLSPKKNKVKPNVALKCLGCLIIMQSLVYTGLVTSCFFFWLVF